MAIEAEDKQRKRAYRRSLTDNNDGTERGLTLHLAALTQPPFPPSSFTLSSSSPQEDYKWLLRTPLDLSQ